MTRLAGRALVLAMVLALAPAQFASAEREGWGYLVEKLVGDGVPRQRVIAVFDDPRVGPFTGLEFSPGRAREPRSMYKGFTRPTMVAAARRCRRAHADAFEQAAREHGVSADTIAAIIYVESGCGQNTGSSQVFTRLARLAMANEPENVRRNIERFSDPDGTIDPETDARLREKARYLENTFYPEVLALFDVAARMRVDLLDIRGSGSGAFGYPQFLPRSYLAYGIDANGDGRVSLYDPEDAAASCARYLSAYGWHPGATKVERRAAVWQYNHSDAYVDAVLTLANQIGKPPPPPKKKVAKTKLSKAKASKGKASRAKKGKPNAGKAKKNGQ